MESSEQSKSEPARESEPDGSPLESSLGYRFRNPALLALALSALKQPLTPETAAARQRLEFLGDAAWNFAVALGVFRTQPQASPGDLTRFRAVWSSRTGLARLAGRIGLPVPASSSPRGPSQRVLAELLESVLGAMVEDGGFEAVRSLASRVISEAADAADRPGVDAKSTLQMLVLSRHATLPAYRLLDRRGPAHHPTFRIGVTVPGPDGEVQVEAEGQSRQAAEQAAAGLALHMLGTSELIGHNIS
jgi:ribonuclease III